MVQIEKRKKKGRPSKADLASRTTVDDDSDTEVSLSAAAAAAAVAEARDIRRSLRRRSFRYNIIDYDEDYLDEDFVSEEEEEEDDVDGKKRKKVKLVVKLNSNSTKNRNSNGRPARRRSVSRLGGDSEEEREREVKKRRIVSGGESEEDEEEEEEEEVENEEDDEGKDNEKEEAKGEDYVSDTPNNGEIDHDEITPLPDRKQLELILDKLQKKDTYGVYSEPVDPEELPDYHEVVDHPMDFSTVRTKLANGSYSTFEQFEIDVFLISSNAMKYNAPDTIYHKQARAIKELAEKKFQRIRMQIERLEKEPKVEPKCEPKLEPKPEQKERSYSHIKKHTKKLINRGSQEALGSDFSSGATLATVDTPNICGADHVSNFERPNNNDGPVESIPFLADNNLDKAEDPQSGKGIVPKFGKRSFVVDENRRATYNISNQPEDRSDSIFTTFEDDKKQLIPVGLSGEFPYARSLARYSAHLGPMAWRIASKRIEQVLPPGFKHGRGWVGEYEPLPRAVFVVEHRKDPFASRLHDAINSRKEDKKDLIVSRSHDAVDCSKDDKPLEVRAQANVHLPDHPSSDGKFASMFVSGRAKSPAAAISSSQHQNPLSRVPQPVMFKEAESNNPFTNFQPNDAGLQQQSRLLRDPYCPENMGAKRVEPNYPSLPNQIRDFVPQKSPHGMEAGQKRAEMSSQATDDQRKDHVPQKQPHFMEVSQKRVETYSQAADDQRKDHVPQKRPHFMEVGQKRADTYSQATDDQRKDHVPQKQPHLMEKQQKQPPHCMDIPQKRPPHCMEMPQKRPLHCMEMPVSMPSDSLPRGKNFLQSLPFKQPDVNGGVPDGLANGKAMKNFVGSNQVITSSPGMMSPQLAGTAAPFPQRQSQDQGLSDPVLVMKMMTENAQKQQNGPVHSHIPAQARPIAPSPRGDSGGGGNAAAAAASAWMSVGATGFRPTTQNSGTNRSQISADSMHNATRMFYPQAMQPPHVEYPVSAAMHFQPGKMGLPFQSFASQPMKVGNEAQAPSRPMLFPQLVPNDLSRFQVQAPWRGPHTPQKQKQETHKTPVDSQQPDLALQL